MPKYLSGRTRRIPQSQLTDDRFDYLDISQAEPNIGDPTVPGPEIPVGQQYQLISVLGFPGERYWIPVGGGLIPGSISVYEEGILTPPGGVSSITQLNFVGDAIRAEGYLNEFGHPGSGVTITVFSPGSQGQVIFNNNNEFTGAPNLFYDNATNYVGVTTTIPTQNLHVDGNIRLTGTIYDSDNQPGLQSQIFVKNSEGGVNWANRTSVLTAAGGTIGQVQFHSNTGLVDGADIFYYDDLNDRVGIGTTQPTGILDVFGISNFTGTTNIDNLNVENLNTIDLTATDLGIINELVVNQTSTLKGEVDAQVGAYVDNVKIALDASNEITTASDDLVLDSYTEIVSIPNTASIGFITARDAYIGVLTALNLNFFDSYITYLNVTGIATISIADIGTANIDQLNVLDAAEIKDLEVTNYFDVSGNANFQKQVDINNLNVSGISTTDNIEISGSNINSKSGDLSLSSIDGNIVTDELVRINNSQDSSDKDSGSVVINGGVGIEKNLNVGATLNVSGETNLSVDGGNTNVGGDLYVGGDIFLSDDLVLDEINANTGVFEELLTTKNLVVTDNSTLSSLNVTGFSTFSQLIDANDGAIINNVAISVFNDNEINTFAGNLLLNSSSGTVIVDDNLTVSETSNFNGNVNLGNASTDLINFTSRVNSNILPSTDNTRDLGSSTLRWNEVYANTFVGAFIGNADTATKLETVTRSTNATHYLTFVNSNNSIADYEYYYTDAGITYNPSTNTLNLDNLIVNDDSSFNGNVILGNSDSDTVIFNSRIDSDILPISNNTKNLGSSSLNWNEVHANNFIGQFIGNADTATRLETVTRSTNATHYLTFVDSNNSVAAYEYYYTDAGIIYNPSTNLLTLVNLAVNGNVDLGSGTGNSITFNGRVDSNILPSTNDTRDLGSSALRWNRVYAKEFVGAVIGNADTATYADRAGLAVDMEFDGLNQILYQADENDTELLPPGVANQLLQSNGPTLPPSWVNPTELSVDSADNLNGGNAGNIPFQESTGNTQFIPNGTSGQVLRSNGSGPPSWGNAYDVAFPAGTRMLFQQTNAPTGWTKLTNNNNKALRVVSGTAGSGGSVDFTSAFTSSIPITGSVTGGSISPHTLTLSQIPSHSHSGGVTGGGSHGHNAGITGSGAHGHNGGTSSGGGHGHNGYTTSSGGHNHNCHQGRRGAGTRGGDRGVHDFNATVAVGGAGNHNHNVFVGGGGHNHSISVYYGGGHGHNISVYGGGNHNHGLNLNASGGGGSHTHGFTNPSFTGNSLNLAVKYIDVIIAQKD